MQLRASSTGERRQTYTPHAIVHETTKAFIQYVNEDRPMPSKASFRKCVLQVLFTVYVTYRVCVTVLLMSSEPNMRHFPWEKSDREDLFQLRCAIVEYDCTKTKKSSELIRMAFFPAIPCTQFYKHSRSFDVTVCRLFQVVRMHPAS